MKNIIFKAILSICLVSTAYAKREIVKVSNLSVTTSKIGGVNQGEISADYVDIDFGGKVFKLNNHPNKLKGTVEIAGRKLSANIAFVSFSTILEENSPLVTLDHFLLEDTQVNFDKEEMFFEIPSVSIGIDNTSASALELRGSCDPKGDPTTKIDIVCLNNGEITAKKAQLANDTLNIEVNALNASITPETITMKSSGNVFNSNQENTLVNELEIKCNNGIKSRFSIDDFISGCLEYSRLHLDDFSQITALTKDKALGLQDIKFIKVNLDENKFDIRSKIKILFYVDLKIKGTMDYIREESVLKMNIKNATIIGMPAKTLILTMLSLFLDEDSIKVEGDTIYIAL